MPADSKSELLNLHYTQKYGKHKEVLIKRILEYWNGEDHQHLSTGIMNFIRKNENNEVDGPFILFITMRNRYVLNEKIIQFSRKEKMNYKLLKMFLNHLSEQQTKIYTPDICVQSLFSHEKYREKKNMMIIFELERVRRIRANSSSTNQNLNQCIRILNTLEAVENDDSYGGVYVPSKAVEGLIQLQKALTYARTSSFSRTIHHCQESRRILSASQNNDFDKIRDIFIWWTYIVESRTFAKCSKIEEALERLKESQNILNKLQKNNPTKHQYIMSIIQDEQKKKTSSTFNRILTDENIHPGDYLHAYHALLSEFIHSKKKPQKKSDLQFSNESFLNLFDAKIRSEVEKPSNRKRSGYKRALNQSLTMGIVGGDFKQYRPQPLLFEHTTLPLNSPLDRMVKNCTASYQLVQAAHERKNSYLILQLVLVVIDLILKNHWIIEVIEHKNSIASKKGDKNKISENNEVLVHAIKQTIACIKKVNQVFLQLEEELLPELELVSWIEYCSKEFDSIKSNENLLKQEFMRTCNKVISLETRNKEDNNVSRIELKLKNGKTYPFSVFSTDIEELFTICPYDLSPGDQKFNAEGELN